MPVIKDGMLVEQYGEEKEAAERLGYQIDTDHNFDFVVTHPMLLDWKFQMATVREVVEFVHAIKLAHEIEGRIAEKRIANGNKDRVDRRDVEPAASDKKRRRPKPG